MGFEVIKTPTRLHLAQTKYAKDFIPKSHMLDSKPYSTPFTIGTKLTPIDSDLYDQHL